MPQEIVINSGTDEIETPDETTAEELLDAVEDTRELWQRELSEAVTVMQSLISEVRAANTENATLRSQVSELLTVNRDLTSQITSQSAQTAETLQRLILQLTPQNQTHHTDDSRTESQESIPLEAVPVAAVEPAAVIPVEVPARRRRAM